MTSKLAKSTIEKWQCEGLKPTFDDIITLNNLGLKVERGSETFSFAACPRIAFLGDYILREPTIAKRIWIDTVGKFFNGNYQTKLFFMCYALNCLDSELPEINNIAKLKEHVVKFRDEVLIRFTETQLIFAIDYVLNGNKPDFNSFPDDESRKVAEDEFAKIYDVPDETLSEAKQLLLQALSQGIDDKVKYEATMTDLERMIIVASLYDGVDVLKNEHTKWAGRFYVVSGKIHERLLEEKNSI